MFEKMDLTKQMSKEEFKLKMAPLASRLGELQRRCRELEIPVMIAFEGFDAAGKGFYIGRLIQSLDPRGFSVHTIGEETEEEKMHPFLWRFWTKTPAAGRIAIYDGSWYRKVLVDRFGKNTKKSRLSKQYEAIRTFERQLADDGTVIIKLLLVIDRKEQKKRFRKLKENKETAWRVDKGDEERNAHYDTYRRMMEEMISKTDDTYAPWTLVEAMDKRYATVKIYERVVVALEEAVSDAGRRCGDVWAGESKYGKDVLADVDLALTCPKKEYKRELKALQKKMELLHGELYRRRIPLVIGFEGWDAGGKGGAIKRLTERMDPRGFTVIPVASPSTLEKSHHYLWRFWNAMPKDGHIAIFDRTWYGRVMVERIEGFCTKEEWQRAYREIREMEGELADHGAIVLKFWMHIDKDEQEKRFRERMENPQKRWKITDEDWRNREKWEQYEGAVCEMLDQTSTERAPWIVVEGNDKYHARLKVLRSVIDAIEKRLKN